jgi:hypothetical protein
VKWVLVFLLGLGLGALAVAALPLRGEQMLMDSMRQLPPRLRARWLNARGIEIPGMNSPQPVAIESTTLRLVGKYGRGPSVEVTGKDSLVFLSLGSEVAIVNFADTANPHVLAEVQAMGLVTQAALRDSFLYLGCNTGQAGIEVWNVADPAAPVFRSRTPSLLSDFCVRDTLLYLTQSLSGPNDTFKVYSIANPENVYMLGSCRDSGDAVTVTNNAAFLADRWGVYSVDVSDPRNPHQVGTYPGMPISVEARGNICCVTFGNPNDPEWLEFDVLDVRSPASMQRLGYLSDAGGEDVYLVDSLVFASGGSGHGFQVINIRDSTHPASIYSCTSPAGYGVWANLSSGFAALAYGAGGLLPMDIHDLHNPAFGRDLLAARPTYDIDVAGSHAFLANLGLKVLDVSDPARPTEIGSVDTSWYESYSVAARDSFAYVMWWVDYGLAAVDVSDPANPKLAGGCTVFNMPEALVVRDSLLYIAESYRFEVASLAQPGAPVVVGACALPDMMFRYGIDEKDTLAFVADGVSGLQIVDVARPDSPAIVGSPTLPNGAIDVAVRDTFAYVVSGNLYIVSVADPSSPYLIDSVVLPAFGWSVAATDSLLFVGSSGYVRGSASEIRLLDIRDPAKPVLHGSLVAPDVVCRLAWAEPRLYAACYQGGVLVVETTAVGLQEPERALRLRGRLRMMPDPVADIVRVDFGEPLGVGGGRLGVYDATGRQMLVRQIGKEVTSTRVSLAGLSSGLYFVRIETKAGVLQSKLVKR